MNSRKILVCVEGQKTEKRVFDKLLSVYPEPVHYEIISYNTNIYDLYDRMFYGKDPSEYDLLQTLKEHEKDPVQKRLLDGKYTDVLLVFDFEPQDHKFNARKIQEMQSYFVESTDMGRLYINYPMVEAFYHLKSIPDPEYADRKVDLEVLLSGGYKALVGRETMKGDHRKFAASAEEIFYIVEINRKKAWQIVGEQEEPNYFPEFNHILAAQLEAVDSRKVCYVLSTCVSFILENPANTQHR